MAWKVTREAVLSALNLIRASSPLISAFETTWMSQPESSVSRTATENASDGVTYHLFRHLVTVHDSVEDPLSDGPLRLLDEALQQLPLESTTDPFE